MLENYENYFKFEPLVRTGSLVINTGDITKETWPSYYYGCLNLMKDGIETEFVQASKVDITFPNTDLHCRLTVPDCYFNLIMWSMLVNLGLEIRPKHIFFDKAITKSTIKAFNDNYVIIPTRESIDFQLLNMTIDDALFLYMDTDLFSMFLGSTINLEDFIELMDKSPRFDELMHADLSNVPIEDVKDAGMKVTNEAIELIKNSTEIMGYDHCLADSLRAKEGTNIKQLKEFAFNIGSKPDGKGGAYNVAVNRSYLNGGLTETMYQFIDSAASRYAQIIMKNNVGDSGNFARIVGLNSIDSIIRDDPDYSCNTRNFLKVTITNKEMLRRYSDRWYRVIDDPDAIEHLLTGNEKWLIGKTLYFRSPEFCASAATGNGVCFKCYGMLAYNNRHINAGKMAAEIFTALTTQERLSSKHLLETRIRKLIWNDNFNRFIDVTSNLLMIDKEATDMTRHWFILIDPNDIILENDSDFDKTEYNVDDQSEYDEDAEALNVELNYNEYITKFYIGNDSGEIFDIHGEHEYYHMYITNTLNQIIKANGISQGDMIRVNFDDLEDVGLFYVKIENDELGKSLDDIQKLMNKKDTTSAYDAHGLTQAINEAAIEGELNVMAVHFEIMLMNQIRSKESVLKKPDWSNPYEEYQILTLTKSLTENPSVTISLLYQNLGSILISPLTYKKTAPSFMDVFFMREPQNFMNDTSNLVDTSLKEEMVTPVVRIHRRNRK